MVRYGFLTIKVRDVGVRPKVFVVRALQILSVSIVLCYASDVSDKIQSKRD